MQTFNFYLLCCCFLLGNPASSWVRADVLKDVECSDDPDGYIIPDPVYCDRYLECLPNRVRDVKLCPEGKVMDVFSGYCTTQAKVDCGDREQLWRTDHSDHQQQEGKNVRTFQSAVGSSHHQHQQESGIEGRFSFSGRRPHPASSTSLNEHKEALRETEPPPTPKKTSGLFGGLHRRRGSHLLAKHHQNQQDEEEEEDEEEDYEEDVGKVTETRVRGREAASDDPLAVGCQGEQEYVVPDPAHCDRYLACPAATVELCPAGRVLDIVTGFCGPRLTTDCSGRELNMREVEAELEEKLKAKVRQVEQEFKQSKQQRPVQDRKAFPRVQGANLQGPIKSKLNSKPQELNTVAADIEAKFPVMPMKKQHSHKFHHHHQDAFLAASTAPLDMLECSSTPSGYLVADPAQCDRYAACSPAGEKSIELCPDGLAFSANKQECDYLPKVDCAGRDALQEARPSLHCPRQNGFFAVPSAVSCTQYVDCRDGVANILNCGAGAVYDEIAGCVHPDQTTRKGCSATEKYGFQCPTSGLTQRFGDHDRLPHPTDCSLFYACLRNGLPRLLSCQRPTVFNPESGLCEDQAVVPGCETFYKEEKVSQENREELAKEIREQLIKEFGLSSI